MNTLQNELLTYRIIVELEKPVNGYWDGGAKSYFEFSPSIERTAGPLAIRWGSYNANLWFVVNCGNSVKSHLDAVRRKLRGNQPRRITVKKLNEVETA